MNRNQAPVPADAKYTTTGSLQLPAPAVLPRGDIILSCYYTRKSYQIQLKKTDPTLDTHENSLTIPNRNSK